MSKLASKLNKRIMAAVLSVAMVMSNMTVYASELTGPQADNTVEEAAVDTEDTSVTPDDAATSDDSSETDAVVDDTTGDTTVTPDDGAADDVTDDDVQTPDTGDEEASNPDNEDGNEEGNEDASLEKEEEVKNEEEITAEKPVKSVEAEEPSFTYDATKKVDVWDFGGATIDGDVNSMITSTPATSIHLP